MKIRENWVYTLEFPSGETYVGKSKAVRTSERWNEKKYGGKVCEAITKYGWENVEKTVVKDNLTDDEALQLEGLLIYFYKSNGKSLNTNNSGDYVPHSHPRVLLTDEEKKERRRAYEAKRRQDPKRKAYVKLIQMEFYKEYNKKIENRIYAAVAQHNRRHPDDIKETPLEAKKRYLETGEIPTYIKLRNK